MTTTMNNLEKLFQIAAMEQMFELMQKMKKDINYDSSVLNFTKNDELNTHALNTDNLKKDKLIIDTKYDNLYIQIQDLKMLVNNLSLKNQTYCDNINQLNLKVKMLENELCQIKLDKERNNQYICAQVRGQQLLTSYPGFSKEPSNSKLDEDEKENIKLKIEERAVLVEEPEPTIEAIVTASEDASDDETDDNSVSEDEVGTDDDEQLEIKEHVEEEEQDEEQHVEEQAVEEVEEQAVEEVEEQDVEDVEEEEEEEEEEVFEIEIDDVTYFATDEENGILYEVTKDGDVGKKVGIIKDGEPIFT